MNPLCRFPIRCRAFTLVELLLAMTILLMMVLALTRMLSDVQQTVSRTQAQVEEFQEARLAFEAMARRLSQATLNSYWGYVYENDTANASPVYYGRVSDLHFVSDAVQTLLPSATGNGHAVFFQAALGDINPATAMGGSIAGLHDLLNCWGYYVDHGSDLKRRPAFMRDDKALALNPERHRFRLMEFRQPPDESVLFSSAFDISNKTDRAALCQWFRGPFKTGESSTADHAVPLAENILAVIIAPYMQVTTGGGTVADSNTELRRKSSYDYDTRRFQWGPGADAETIASKHKPPAMLEVTLIAADEKSYARLEQREGVAGAANKVRAVFEGLLADPTRFAPHLNGSPESGTYEIDTIESRLNDLQIHYKIFSTTVHIQTAKWITERETL